MNWPYVLLVAFLGGVAGALIVIASNEIRRELAFRKLLAAMEKSNCEPFSLRERLILPPHKSAARPSNVMALARKPKVASK